MNYELALKLKDAGFLQKGLTISKNGCVHYGTPQWLAKKNYCGCYCYEPTLSELIGACGIGLWTLQRVHDGHVLPSIKKWTAISQDVFTNNNLATIGATPEEAVANLWLALNQK